MNARLLLLLPHRQVVFTFPKVLRIFFRHDRKLYGEISKLVYRMIQGFYNEAAGRTIHSAAVIAYASEGDFARFNPHLHAIFLEGGFDRDGQFVHVPSLDLAKLSQHFRSRMVAFFLKRSLLVEEDARGRARGERPVPLGVQSVLPQRLPAVPPPQSSWSKFCNTFPTLAPA
jgi:hypothetical protein